jgi:hypothetical protein
MSVLSGNNMDAFKEIKTDMFEIIRKISSVN